jgi:hypothetical protein
MFGALSMQASGSIVTAASTAPTILENLFATTGAGTVTHAAGFSVQLAQAILTGDQIIVVATIKATTTRGGTISDSLGSTWNVQVPTGAQGAIGEVIFGIASPPAGAAPLVTIFPPAGASIDIQVYHLRGKTVTLDTANVWSGVQTGQPGTNPFTVGPYNASAQAFAVLGLFNSLAIANDSGATALGWVEDKNQLTRYYPLMMHKFTAAAVSGASFTLTNGSGSNTTWIALVASFTY